VLKGYHQDLETDRDRTAVMTIAGRRVALLSPVTVPAEVCSNWYFTERSVHLFVCELACAWLSCVWVTAGRIVVNSRRCGTRHS